MEIEITNRKCPLHLIEECIYKANQIIHDSICENSRKAMKSDLNYWRAWCYANQFDFSQGISKDHIVAFIVQHSEGIPTSVDQELIVKGVKRPGTHKMSTIERRIASLSTFLNLQKMPNFCYDPAVLFLLKRLKTQMKESEAWGEAITVDVLNQLLETCRDSIIDIRDKALILFGFSTGGRRRSEIADATMDFLYRRPDGNFTYNLKHSKTNHTGKDEIKPLFGRAAMALAHWLHVSSITSGSIFRGVNKAGKINDCGLSDGTVSDIVKKRCRLAKIDPTKKYTAHSLRSGFVTEGGKRGKPIGDIMKLTGHRNMKQVLHYYDVGNVENNSAAYLAG